jgi:hypothetical protein
MTTLETNGDESQRALDRYSYTGPPGVFAGTPGEHTYNPIVAVHGGCAATLIDSACASAVHFRLTS